MARLRKIVDEKRVIELASKGLIQEEIAAFENVSVDTLTRHYAESIKRGYALRNGSLRKKQFEMAMEGNPVMLVWLGKQCLDQRDRTEHNVSGEITLTLEQVRARIAEFERKRTAGVFEIAGNGSEAEG